MSGRAHESTRTAAGADAVSTEGRERPRVAEILERIVERRRERLLAESGGRLGAPGAPGEAAGGPALLDASENRFLAALRSHAGGARRAVVAEVKMGSPRLGSLAGRVDPEAQARLYAEGGAACLSVVVEPDFFHGSYDLLAACREVSGLPAIAKDFLVHPVQLDRAAAAGADAVLLIAALYRADELAAWAAAARARGLVPLVETHDPRDLELLAGRDWELVGVNNRDLVTFEVDLEHSIALAPRLPAGALKVAESGIRSGAEVERLTAAGFDAFLVGESLLTAGGGEATADKLAELVGTAAPGAPAPRAAGTGTGR